MVGFSKNRVRIVESDQSVHSVTLQDRVSSITPLVMVMCFWLIPNSVHATTESVVWQPAKATPVQRFEQISNNLSEIKRLSDQANPTTLEEAASAVLSNNPDLLSAQKQADASELYFLAAKKTWLPYAEFYTDSDAPALGQLFNTTTAVYPNNVSGGDYATNTYTETYYEFSSYPLVNINLMVNWDVFSPVRQPLINQRGEEAKATELAIRVVARSLILATQVKYIELQELDRLISIFEKIYHDNRQELDIINAQYKAEMTSVGSVLQQETLLLNQMQQLIGFYQRKAALSAQLAVLMGLPPGSRVCSSAETSSQQTLQDAIWPHSLEQSIRTGLDLREEIKIALAEASSARWNASRLMNEYLPVLSLGALATYGILQGYYEGTVGRDPEPFLSRQTSTDVILGLGIKWKFYDGGINATQSNAARSMAESKLQLAENARVVVGSEIQTSYTNYESSKLALLGAETAFQAAAQSVEVARTRYEAGIGSLTTIVQANELYGEAASNLFDTRKLLRDSLAELYRYSAEWPPFISDHLSFIDQSKVGNVQ